MKSYQVSCILLQDGSTALHVAASLGRAKQVQILFRSGADINALDKVSYYVCDEMSWSVGVSSKKHNLV